MNIQYTTFVYCHNKIMHLDKNDINSNMDNKVLWANRSFYKLASQYICSFYCLVKMNKQINK